MREFVFGGLLITPFVKYALLALLLFLPLRLVLVHLDIEKWFWHAMLAETAMYLCILAFLNIFV